MGHLAGKTYFGSNRFIDNRCVVSTIAIHFYFNKVLIMSCTCQINIANWSCIQSLFYTCKVVKYMA